MSYKIQSIDQHGKKQFFGLYLTRSSTASDSQAGYSFSGLSNTFYQQEEMYLLQNISILLYLLPILQLAESFASDQQIHSGYDIFLTLHKNLCNMLFVVF